MSVLQAGASAEIPRGPKAFAAWHPWDRNFFLGYVALLWLAVLMGFVPDAIAHVRQHKTPYPLAVHIHAAIMVAWLSLLTTQTLLIRFKAVATHRKLGLVGMGLAGAVVVIGPFAAIAADRTRMAIPTFNPGLLSVQLAGIVGFAGATGAALLLRAKAAAHKRLMLLGTTAAVDAAFFRWWGPSMVKLFGAAGFWPFMARFDLGSTLMILGLCLYDVATRRRIHPAVLGGGALIVGCNLISGALNQSAWWTTTAAAIIGR